MKIASHHVVFNHQDLVLQVIEHPDLKPELIAVDYAVYGHPVTTQAQVDTAIERRGILPFHLRILRYLDVFKMLFQGNRLAKNGLSERALEKFFDMTKIKELSTEELYEAITEKAGFEYVDSVGNHLLASESSSTLCIIVFMIAAEGKKDWDADFCCDLAELMISSSDQDVVSAGVPTELRVRISLILFQIHDYCDLFQKLAKTIYKDESHEEFINNQDGDSWLRSHSIISKEYLNFLKNYGHRCLREFDLISCPWEEDSKPLVETLQSMVQSMKLKSEMAGPTAEAFRNQSLDDRLNNFKTPLSNDTKKRLKFVMPYVYQAVALRETCKSMIIKRIHELRLAYRTLAQRLCVEGKLPRPELIFHLSHFEIGQLMKSRNPSLLLK